MSIKETLTKHLVGRRITTATDATLTLDDGTTIRLYESHYDRCAEAGGEWKILAPDMLESAITHVEYESEGYKDFYTRVTTCRITILHNQHPIALGNGCAETASGGCYFSALSLEIAADGTIVYNEEVISS